MRYDPTHIVEFKEGHSSFKVIEAEERTSQNNNNYIKMEIEVKDEFSTSKKIYENLVPTKNALWKVKQFCDSAELKFDNGELTPTDCIGRTGFCFTEKVKGTNEKIYTQIKAFLPNEKRSLSENDQLYRQHNDEDKFDDVIPF